MKLSPVLTIAGSIFGGYMASKAMKKARQMLEQQATDNQNWYDRRINQDFTKTATAQNAIRKAIEYADQLNRKTDATAAVMGSTDQASATARKQAANTIANVISSVAQHGDTTKEIIEQQYRQNKSNINQQKIKLQLQKAQEIAKATSFI